METILVPIHADKVVPAESLALHSQYLQDRRRKEEVLDELANIPEELIKKNGISYRDWRQDRRWVLPKVAERW